MLEYLFGNGQYQSRQLIANFQSSSRLVEGLAQARQQVAQQLAAGSPDAQKNYQVRYASATDEQVVRTIVLELRGFLHHQSSKRPRTWHPGLQKGYGIDACFLGAVSQHVLMKLVGEILVTDDAKEKLATTGIVQSDKTQLGK